MQEIKRVIRSKKQAKISYDKLSKWYDFLAGGSEKKYRDTGLAKLSVKQGEKVLEIGFGTGYCISLLARSVGKDGKVYGIDISERMLNMTASRLEKSGLNERTELQCGDAANLPYNENFFDAIFMSFTLELFDTPDIPIILQELRRVLKDCGRICVVSMSKEGKTGLMIKLYDWAHETFPNYVDCRPIYVRQAFENANFEIVGVTKMSLLSLPIEIILAKKNSKCYI